MWDNDNIEKYMKGKKVKKNKKNKFKIIGHKMLSTFLKTITIKKDVYSNFIMHSFKRILYNTFTQISTTFEYKRVDGHD